ncbi:MAG: diguanylate cyclase [Anaerolineae bacterium]
MQIHASLFATLLALSALTAAVIAYVAWRRRIAPGAMPLVSLMLAVVIWSAGYALYWAQYGQPISNFGLVCTYVGVVTAPTALLLFAVEFTERGRWLTRHRFLLAIEPLLTLAILTADSLQSLFSGGASSAALHSPLSNSGPWFWVNIVYSYTLVLVSILLLVLAWRRAASPYRDQLQIVLLGTLFPVLGNLGVFFFPVLFADIDPTPFAFTMTGLILAYGLFRYGIFDLAPVARGALVDNLSDSVLVVDAQDRIVDLNPLARKLLHLPAAGIIGQPVSRALAYYPELIAPLTLKTSREILLHGEELRYLDCRLTPLFDRWQRARGYLVVLHDITERKQMEGLLREQRSIAEALRDTASALNSTLDLDRILERILTNVGRVVAHDAANIALIQEEGIARCVRATGYAERGQAQVPEAIPISEMLGFRQMLETGEPIIVSDTWLDPGWAPAAHAGWVRSYAGMPIRLRGQVIGFINLDSAIPCFFRMGHTEPLRAFADQVAIAIENARLYQEAHRRADALSLLLDIGLTISADLNIEQILRRLLDECLRILPIDSFYVAIYDDRTDIISHSLFYDQGEYRSLTPRQVHPTQSVSGEVIDGRVTLYIRDALDPEQARPHHIVHVGGQPARSYVGIPLIARGHVVGVISMQNYAPNAYSEDQIHLLETIATQAAVTVENARLYTEVQNELGERTSEVLAREQAEAALRAANELLKMQLARVQALENELRSQAIHDPLTGLYNRRFLHEALERELARALREGKVMSAVMLDIDHFKRINDTYFHEGGDQMLIALADLLKNGTRREDIPCRYGGEEFLIVLPSASTEVAYRRAEQWRLSFQELAIHYQGYTLRATISLGVATFPFHADAAQSLVRAADAALYGAKRAGRNRTVVSTLLTDQALA